MVLFKIIISFLQDREYRGLLATTLLILVGGSVVYHYLEGWEWIDCFYFSIITLTTIGYGDFSPQTVPGKLFTMFYILLGMGIILSFIDTVYRHYSDVRKKGKSDNGNGKSKS